MQARVSYFVLLFACATYCVAQKTQTAFPAEIYLGRYSFIDVGPPFETYEIVSVKSTPTGVALQRVTITPPGDNCSDSPRITVAAAENSSSLSEILGNENPCSIPEKDLKREEKRCKHCLVFSGAKVTMQAKCGTGIRTVRMNVLDRDMFDPHANTPTHTSRTMELMGRLDSLLGSDNVFSRSMFDTTEAQNSKEASALPLVKAIERGELDGLFYALNTRISELTLKARTIPAPPSVSIAGSVSPAPLAPVLPSYPPIARAAHVEGDVKVKFIVGLYGADSQTIVIEGPPMLKGTVSDAIRQWKFHQDDIGRSVEVTFHFLTQCSVAPRQ